MRWLIFLSLTTALNLPVWSSPTEETTAAGLPERGLVSQISTQLSAVKGKASDQAAGMVEQAMGLLGVPYRRGGNSESTGFDCSGFVRHLYEQSVGQILPRRAVDQAARTGFDPKAGLRCGVGPAGEDLDHAANRTAAVQGRNIAPDDFDALDLVEHQMLNADQPRRVLARQRDAVDQHQHLARRRTAQEQRGHSATPAVAGELHTGLGGQQCWQIHRLRAFDVLTQQNGGVRQCVSEQLRRSCSSDDHRRGVIGDGETRQERQAHAQRSGGAARLEEWSHGRRNTLPACSRFPASADPCGHTRNTRAAPCWPVSGLAETTPVAFPTVDTVSGVRHRSGNRLTARSVRFRPLTVAGAAQVGLLRLRPIGCKLAIRWMAAFLLPV